MSPQSLTLTDTQLAGRLRVPGTKDHKYTRGVLGVWAGSQTYPGAAVLACAAAVRTGVGLVRLQAPQRVADLVLARRPEVVPVAGSSQALLIGPGISAQDVPRAAEADAALALALGCPATPPLPAVLDAGALPLLACRLQEGARCWPWHVLTPHAGEAASLLSDLGQAASRQQVEEDPEAAVRALSAMTGATVLLKGNPTLVSGEGGQLLVRLDPGPAWLATAGSGDVLAGVLGALLAVEAASWERPDSEVYRVGEACVTGRGQADAAEPGAGSPGPAPVDPSAGEPQAADSAPQPQGSTKSVLECYQEAISRDSVAIPGNNPGGVKVSCLTGLVPGWVHPLLVTALGGRIHARAADICAGTGPGRQGHPIAALDLVETLPRVLEALLEAMQESAS